MKWSLRCGSVAVACLALALVIGGCPPVTQPTPGKTSYAVAPEFNPPSGFYPAAVDVQIASTTVGAKIYYTTDESDPSETNGQLYSGSIHVDQSMHIKAIAFADGVNASLTIEAVYTIGGNQPPKLLNASVTGTLTPGQIGSVTVSCQANDADGFVTSVVADLSSLGTVAAQPLVHQANGSWSWQGKVQPMSPGTQTVAMVATDDQGATTTVEATIDVQVKPGEQVWAYTTEGTVRSSPALADDGTIYVGSEDRYLYAFNSDGTLKWKFWATSSVVGSPAIGPDGTIYVAGDSYMFAVNPDGSLKWNYAVGGPVFSSAAIGPRSAVYFGSSDGNLYALDSAGKLKWTLATGGPVESSPAIGADGTIYVGSDDGNLYAVYPNGKTKWTFATGGPVQSNPAIDQNGTIYVGSSDGSLYAIRPNGTRMWQSFRGSALTSSPVIGGNGAVYIGCSGGSLCAIKAVDGTFLWNYLTSRSVSSTPAVALDGTIYFGSDDHKLYALTEDGRLLWSFVGTLGMNASPVISPDGIVYVGSDDRHVYAIQGSFSMGDSPWPVGRGNTWRSGAVPGLPDNLPPVFLSSTASSAPVAVVGRASLLTINCQAEDFDGTIQSLVADLSTVGGPGSQVLTPGATGTYQWSGSLTLPASGQQTITLKATDNDGATTSASVVLQVMVPPVISNVAVSGTFSWSHPVQTTVSCDVADAGGAVNSVVANLSALGGAPAQVLTGTAGHYSWTGTLSPPGSGAKTVAITATDANGVVTTANKTVDVADLPYISNMAVSRLPVANVSISTTVSCTVTNSDNTVQSVTVDLTDLGGPGVQTLVKGAGNVWSWTGGVSPSSGGQKSIAFLAKDVRGGAISEMLAVRVLLPPAISNMTITQPISRSQTALIAVSCQATDPDGTVQAVVADLRAIGGDDAQALTKGANNTWSWSGQLAPPGVGPTSIVFTATDADGVTSAATFSFQFASTTLVINNATATGALMAGQAGTLTVSCIPSASDGIVKSVTVDLSTFGIAGPQALSSLGGGAWGATFSVTPASAGTKTVTFGATDSNNDLATATATVQVNPKTIWMYDSLLQAESSPAVLSNGAVYIGLYGSTFKGLVAINPDGTVKWQYATNGQIQSSPAVGRDGSIYIGCDDKFIHAVKPDGTVKWTFLTGGEVNSSPAIGPDGVIYVGSDDNKVYALDPDLGTLVWPTAFVTGGKVTSSPAVSDDGVIYIGSWDKNVYAINTADGTQAWKHAVTGMVHAAPAVVGNVIYVSDLSGYLYALDRLTGNEIWNSRLDGYLFSSPTVGSDGTVYVGADDGNLYAINAAGTQKWAYDTGGAVRSTPAIASDGTVYVGSNNNGLLAINSDGSLKWKFVTTDVVRSSPAIGADGTVYMASFDGKVYAIQGSAGLANSAWPMFRHGPLHSGYVSGR